VSSKESFAKNLTSVCDDLGWELLPSGINVKLADGRHQVISLEFFESRGTDLVRLMTRIGGAKELSRGHLEQSLRANVSMAHGALALMGDDLCMTDTLSLADADLAEIESAIFYMAEMADYYERILFGTDVH
jgi:hypothetical protein